MFVNRKDEKMTTFLKGVGERMKWVRNKRKLRQADVAAALACSVTHYTKIETGKNNASESITRLFASLYSVHPEWLKTGQGEPFLTNSERIANYEQRAIGAAEVRESPVLWNAHRPGWRGRLDTILDEQEDTIEKSHRDLGVSYEAILGGVGRRLDKEEGGK